MPMQWGILMNTNRPDTKKKIVGRKSVQNIFVGSIIYGSYLFL